MPDTRTFNGEAPPSSTSTASKQRAYRLRFTLFNLLLTLPVVVLLEIGLGFAGPGLIVILSVWPPLAVASWALYPRLIDASLLRRLFVYAAGMTITLVGASVISLVAIASADYGFESHEADAVLVIVPALLFVVGGLLTGIAYVLHSVFEHRLFPGDASSGEIPSA